jgi:ribonucleoside-diphosphate reductase alpha chain
MAGILDNKEIGTRLTSSEVSDLCCYIADAVYSGGIRRAAMICLFDMTDEAMLGYKAGTYWDKNAHRARVNVSAVALRESAWKETPSEPKTKSNHTYFTEVLPTTKEQYQEFWKFVQNSGTGEPGIYWTDDPDSGTNPCCEIALKDKQFCNLTTINFSTVTSQADLIARAKTAAFLGTLQAGFTDFHYLGDEWASNCEEEALLGVSVTGIADGNNYRKFDWKAVAETVVRRNVETAKLIGINSAARTTCIKPEGTTSLVCGTSSGIHGRHAHYYIRRMRLEKSEAIAQYLIINHPELVAQDKAKPTGIVLELPQKSPDRSIYRTESVMDCLERVKFFSEEWVKNGHVSGGNTHNVSCTISVKPDEWKQVGVWMWNNRNYYNGIAVLPYDGGHYIQAPFEDCTKEKYEAMMKTLKKVDLSKIVETEDNTEIGDTIACAGGACSI